MQLVTPILVTTQVTKPNPGDDYEGGWQDAISILFLGPLISLSLRCSPIPQCFFLLIFSSFSLSVLRYFQTKYFPFQNIFLHFLLCFTSQQTNIVFQIFIYFIYLLEKFVWSDTSLNFVHTIKSPQTACSPTCRSPACRGTPAFVANASSVLRFLLGIETYCTSKRGICA